MPTLRQKIEAREFIVTVEFNPPKGADLGKALARLARLAGRVDAINVTDSPMARIRMGSIAASVRIERETGVETIFNFTCRDRNLIAQHADLMGAHALGLRNVLCVTGDPPSLGDVKQAKGVYEHGSVGLLSLVSRLNAAVDPAGKPLAGATDLYAGAVVSPGARAPEAELAEARRKREAGARFFLSQPVFDADGARAFHDSAAGIGAPVIFGVMPLKSTAFARYLHESVPGIVVPQEVFDRLGAAPEADAAREGVRLAAELAVELKRFAPGVHLMPTGPMESVEGILDALGR